MMEPKLSKLSIGQETAGGKGATRAKDSSEMVADSWEDEATSGNAETRIVDDDDATTPSQTSPGLSAPPPTPASPNSALPSWDSPHQVPYTTRKGDRVCENQRRPEKTTAVAGRLIAAGLGMEVPKAPKEQKAYDRAIRESEMERKNKERDEKREKEKAQVAMWES